MRCLRAQMCAWRLKTNIAVNQQHSELNEQKKINNKPHECGLERAMAKALEIARSISDLLKSMMGFACACVSLLSAHEWRNWWFNISIVVSTKQQQEELPTTKFRIHGILHTEPKTPEYHADGARKSRSKERTIIESFLRVFVYKNATSSQVRIMPQNHAKQLKSILLTISSSYIHSFFSSRKLKKNCTQFFDGFSNEFNNRFFSLYFFSAT